MVGPGDRNHCGGPTGGRERQGLQKEDSVKEQNVLDDLVNGANADEELTSEETRQDMLDLLSSLSINRGERGEINLDAAKGKAKAKLTQAVVDLNAEYENSWNDIAGVLGLE